MDFKECIKLLNKSELFGINLDLKNITNLMERLGNPHKNLRYIHVGGTNGKGSVCAMLSSILNKAGYKVGLYTSPHLIDVTERVRVNEKDISKKDFIRYFQRVYDVYQNETYFEILTAIAFLFFKEKNVDVAILEVGLGGRYDATNIITPLVSIITTISIEHKEYLGSTIKRIAYDKSFIIKNKVPCVTQNKGIALEMIKKRCKKMDSILFLSENIDSVNKNNLKTNLIGEFQKSNAEAAIKTVEILVNRYKFKILDNQIKKGLMNVKWPARLMIKNKIIYDCCHNPGASKVLVKELKRLKMGKITLLIGILKDKNYKSMIKYFSKIALKVIITKPNTTRSLNPKLIKDEFDKYNITSKIIENPKKAIKYIKSLDEKVLITGSIYLVGDALRYG